jgi:hypothetical protein
MDEGTILIKNRTRERLRQIGSKGQTYDQLINELIDARKKRIDSPDSRFETLQSSESAYP